MELAHAKQYKACIPVTVVLTTSWLVKAIVLNGRNRSAEHGDSRTVKRPVKKKNIKH